MPGFQRVSGRSADRFFQFRGQVDLTEYQRFVADLETGDVAEARLAPGESERAVKRRITVVAKGQQKRVQYSTHAPEGCVIFRVK